MEIERFVTGITALGSDSRHRTVTKKSSQGSTMYLTSQSNTQVYSPFGSLVVEQHAPPSRFEVIDLPPQRKAGSALSNQQAAVGLKLQHYYPIHFVGPTPTRLQILLNMLLQRNEPR
jgi:hypothetical protein